MEEKENNTETKVEEEKKEEQEIKNPEEKKEETELKTEEKKEETELKTEEKKEEEELKTEEKKEEESKEEKTEKTSNLSSQKTELTKEEKEEKEEKKKKKEKEEIEKPKLEIRARSDPPFDKIICKELTEEANEEENFKCFDCETSPANWVCVYNGIYLCAQCAGEHRYFGPTISNLKFLLLDNLNEFEINLMKLSGNKRLKGLLNLYKVEFNKDEKYLLFSSQLLEYYRNVLYNKLAGKAPPKPPNQNKCLDMMDNVKIVTRPFLEKVIVRSDQEIKEELKKEEEKMKEQEESKKDKCGLQ